VKKIIFLFAVISAKLNFRVGYIFLPIFLCLNNHLVKRCFAEEKKHGLQMIAIIGLITISRNIAMTNFTAILTNISIILTIFYIFIGWRIYKIYDIALNAHTHLMATFDLIETALTVKTLFSIGLRSENILWLADLHKDRHLIRKLFSNNNINKFYNEFFKELKLLDANGSPKINAEQRRKEMLRRLKKLRKKIENNSVLSQFIDHPIPQYFQLKIQRTCKKIYK